MKPGETLCKMGQKHSKKHDVDKQTASGKQQDQYEIDSPEKNDVAAVENLRKELKEDPNTFILNMLLMSFMFFKDYQTEMLELADISPESGQKLNSNLLESHQKQVLTPDVVMEKVNKYVKFQSLTNSDVLEPLILQRMFVLHDSIEVISRHDVGEYSIIDNPSYRAFIEESRDNKGFVLVKLCMPPKQNAKYDFEDSTTLNGDILNESNCNTNNDSGINTPINYDSDGGYSKITAAQTPNRLEISDKDIYVQKIELPLKCITPINVRNIPEVELDENDEDDKENNSDEKPPELFITYHFLNSEEFMNHFSTNVFPHNLAEMLGFSQNSLTRATSISGSIFCTAEDTEYHQICYEVIPSVPMPWPAELAYEWPLRERITIKDKRTRIAYKWPTENMVNKVRQLDAVIIPRGFIPKKGENIFQSIEWEAVLPKAERHLETRMSHAQMRIFLFIATLYKTFIEPKTKRRGLLLEHIRFLMFWECEANYILWPEDKLGAKLKLVLQNLYSHLGKETLSHYFIRSRNVFKNIPGCDLREAQIVINDIVESPVLYMLSALKNLKYVREDFYPIPDLDELYSILTEKYFPFKGLPPITQKSVKSNKQEDPEQKWNRLYIQQQSSKKSVLAVSKNSTNGSRNAVYIDVQATFTLDLIRTTALLKFFISHFIKIAKCSLVLSTTTQALFYLKQAFYLTKLLEMSDGESAMEFQDQIKIEENISLKQQANQESISSITTRNVSSNVFHASDKLHVKGKTINLRTLSNGFSADKLNTSGIKRKAAAGLYRPRSNSDKLTTFAQIHKDADKITKTTEKSRSKKSVAFKSIKANEEHFDTNL